MYGGLRYCKARFEGRVIEVENRFAAPTAPPTAPFSTHRRLNQELALPPKAYDDSRVCLGTITATAVARPSTPNGLLYVRVKTQPTDLMVTDAMLEAAAAASGDKSWAHVDCFRVFARMVTPKRKEGDGNEHARMIYGPPAMVTSASRCVRL